MKKMEMVWIVAVVALGAFYLAGGRLGSLGVRASQGCAGKTGSPGGYFADLQ